MPIIWHRTCPTKRTREQERVEGFENGIEHRRNEKTAQHKVTPFSDNHSFVYRDSPWGELPYGVRPKGDSLRDIAKTICLSDVFRRSDEGNTAISSVLPGIAVFLFGLHYILQSSGITDRMEKLRETIIAFLIQQISIDKLSISMHNEIAYRH